MIVKPPQYQLVNGNAANMGILRTGEVDLIFTGPPYYSKDTEELLKEPVRNQTQLKRVRKEITSFALSLKPVFNEMRRVLNPDGVIVIQSKDIHYQNVYISLSELYRRMIENTGLSLITRVYWHKKGKRSRALRFRDNPIVGAFRADEVEDIMVYSKGNIPSDKDCLVELNPHEIERSWKSPLWDMASASRHRKHHDQFPDSLPRRIIALFSRKGDLVVDPFAGSGTTLKVAVSMGRRAVGYEIISDYTRVADQTITELIMKDG